MPEEYNQLKPKSRRYLKMHPRSYALQKLREIVDKLDNLPPEARVTFTVKVSTLTPAESAQTSITWQLRPRL